MNKNLVMVLAGLPLCAGLLCSCASLPTQTVQEPWGMKNIYKDASGRIVRIEKCGPDYHFIPGACIIQFIYDTNGERVAKQNLNSNHQLVCNDQGYALAKYAYPADSAGEPVVEETFFDANNQPVVTKSGFAMMTCTENPDGRANTAHFSDFQGKPVPSIWFGVSNVVDVQYFYLQGITPIVCGVFRDGSGNIIDRKQLKGLTTQVVVTDASDDSDDNNYDVPVYVHVDSGYHGGEDHGDHGHR